MTLSKERYVKVSSRKRKMIGREDWSNIIQTPPSLTSTPVYLGSNVRPQARLSLTDDEVTNLLGAFSSDDRKPRTPIQNTQQNNADIYESRAIMLTNVNPGTTDEQIMKVFDQKNCLKLINRENIDQGVIILDYFDLREASRVKQSEDGITLNGNIIRCQYAPPKSSQNSGKPQNNGTIVIFNLKSDVTDDHLRKVFGEYGEIREIRSTPLKSTQRFIEFWDTRASQKAYDSMNGKYVKGNRASIEFSTPGGLRGKISRASAVPRPPTTPQKV